MQRYLLFLFLCLFILGCNSDLKLLSKYMAGEFDNSGQRGSSYQRVSVKIEPIWSKQPGEWLFVQQFHLGENGAAILYRERVYKLGTAANRRLLCEVYLLDSSSIDASLYPLNSDIISTSLSPQNVLPIEGCSFRFQKTGTYFKGESSGKDCLCHCQGAQYIESNINVYENRLESREQPIKPNGRPSSPRAKRYVFKRLGSIP